MTEMSTVIVAILAIGLVYVVVPLAIEAHRNWVAPRQVTCPQKQLAAEVTVKPWRAAFTSLARKPWLEVKACTFWPECRGCDESCKKSF